MRAVREQTSPAEPRWYPAGIRSKFTRQEPVEFEWLIPASFETDAAAQGAETDVAAGGRRRSQLSDGLAVPGNDNGFAGLHGPDQLGKAVFGFGDADVHGFLSIAVF